jgi:hypothetical protein
MSALKNHANTASREVAFDNAVDVMIDQGGGWRFGAPAHGHSPRHRGPMIAADDRTIAVQRLLDDLCGELGLCLPSRARARLLQSPPMNPDELTDAVFAAAGLDPRLFSHLRGQVHARVQSGLSLAGF